MTRTVLIMAGGTGGHIMPGLAVAEYLRAAGWDVRWLGARGGMEERLVPPHGYPLALVRARGIRGKGLFAKLLAPGDLLVAFWQSARTLLRIKPDVVLGLGGYVAFPGAMMASLLNRPLAIHEQNAIAGLSNRILARLADKVMESFPGALAGAEWTGNPVRAGLAALPQPSARYAGRSGPLQVLVVGGSLGAQALNECVPRALALIPAARRPRVVHQSGTKHLEFVRMGYVDAGLGAPAPGTGIEVRAFIDDMTRCYAEADLVLCRAGATTIAELGVGGIPAVLVPFPHAVDDHQTANARFLSERGAAVLIPQEELTPVRLADLLMSLDRTTLAAMAERARTLGKPDAARIVAERCAALAEGAQA